MEETKKSLIADRQGDEDEAIPHQEVHAPSRRSRRPLPPLIILLKHMGGGAGCSSLIGLHLASLSNHNLEWPLAGDEATGDIGFRCITGQVEAEARARTRLTLT